MNETVQRLRQEVEATESHLQNLKLQLQRAEQIIEAAAKADQATSSTASGLNGNVAHTVQNVELLDHLGDALDSTQLTSSWPLSAREYKRYGRQLIMPEIGLPGQLQLKKAKILIVGVGGLGCPAAAYLAGAGVGTLGLMDGDTVELSNLHRQVAHSTERIGWSKVDSASTYLKSLNPDIDYRVHRSHLAPESAIPIFEQYDLVLDCTDHPTSRYLISDACVLTQKPLVSASALKTEGQLIVLNDPPRPPGDLLGGPCYRCIFPKPPPADSVLSCGEGGILGPVVGVMGVLQALEAIKLVMRVRSEVDTSTDNRENSPQQPRASLLMFSAFASPQFRNVRMRSRKANCAACSKTASISAQTLQSGSLDYAAFCGVAAPIGVLPPGCRISPANFVTLPSDEPKILIDTRDATQFTMCSLPHSFSVPWTGNAESWLESVHRTGISSKTQSPTYVICRFGNDSQLAVQALLSHLRPGTTVKDIEGGFQSWREQVDPEWPDY